MTRVYMAVTNDRYELPVAVASGPVQLARVMGIDYTTVYKGLIKTAAGVQRYSKWKFYIVEVEDN